MKRCFVAMRIHQETRRALSEVQRELTDLRHDARKLRPVAPQNFHITLKFLGATADAQVASLRDALAEVARHAVRVEPTVAGLGAFPTPSRPRVVFAALGKESSTVAELARAIDQACSPLGYEPESKPLVPHVTIARIEQARARGRISEWLEGPMRGRLFGPADGSTLVLYESILKPTGAIYRPLAELPIGTMGSEQPL